MLILNTSFINRKSDITSYLFQIIYSHHQAECEIKIKCSQLHGRFENSNREV